MKKPGEGENEIQSFLHRSLFYICQYIVAPRYNETLCTGTSLLACY